MNECTCRGKRYKVGNPIRLTKDHGRSLKQWYGWRECISRSYPGEVTTVKENIIAIRYQGSICKIYIHLLSKKNYAGYPIKWHLTKYNVRLLQLIVVLFVTFINKVCHAMHLLTIFAKKLHRVRPTVTQF